MLSLYQSSEEQEALPIWGFTHRLLLAKDLKVTSTAGALTVALLYCQPFHFGIKHHLIVSTKVISNSQKAPTAYPSFRAQELLKDRSWISQTVTPLLRGLCSATPLPATLWEGKALLSPPPPLNCSLPLHTASSHPRNDQLEPTEEWAAWGLKAKHNRKYPHKSSVSWVG